MTQSPTISLSGFTFVEKSGSTVILDCYRADNAPLATNAQPTGVDVNSPTDGVLLSILRDGKPAVVVTQDVVFLDGTGFDYTNYNPGETGYAGTGRTFANLIASLNSLGNGFVWSFTPAFANWNSFSDPGGSLESLGIEAVNPRYLLPVPTKFPPQAVKLGGSVQIPIAVRLTQYTNNCPWTALGGLTVTGDDPVLDDTATVTLLGLSDRVGALVDQTVTVQSATVAAAGDPYTLTSDYGPTELTFDAEGRLQITLNTGQSVTAGVLSPQIDGIVVSFDEALVSGATLASGRLRSVYAPLRNGQTNPLSSAPPNVTRKSAGAFCVRSDETGETVYSEPRNGLWRLASDYKARLKALLYAGFSPYSLQVSRFPVRSGAVIKGFKPKLAVYESLIVVVYQTVGLLWVTCSSTDQLMTLGAEVTIFNQTYPGETNLAVDASTGSIWYVMAIRSDALSWLSMPTANDDPDRLPQVLIVRRRDASGNSLPFVKATTAGISGTLWENVVFVDQPSNGYCGIEILPIGTVLVSCGNTLLQSLDSGTTWTDANSGAAIEALSTQTSGELVSGSSGGTLNP